MYLFFLVSVDPRVSRAVLRVDPQRESLQEEQEDEGILYEEQEGHEERTPLPRGTRGTSRGLSGTTRGTRGSTTATRGNVRLSPLVSSLFARVLVRRVALHRPLHQIVVLLVRRVRTCIASSSCSS